MDLDQDESDVIAHIESLKLSAAGQSDDDMTKQLASANQALADSQNALSAMTIKYNNLLSATQSALGLKAQPSQLQSLASQAEQSQQA